MEYRWEKNTTLLLTEHPLCPVHLQSLSDFGIDLAIPSVNAENTLPSNNTVLSQLIQGHTHSRQ